MREENKKTNPFTMVVSRTISCIFVPLVISKEGEGVGGVS